MKIVLKFHLEHNGIPISNENELELQLEENGISQLSELAVQSVIAQHIRELVRTGYDLPYLPAQRKIGFCA